MRSSIAVTSQMRGHGASGGLCGKEMHRGILLESLKKETT
jgi:hypothetical protein